MPPQQIFRQMFVTCIAVEKDRHNEPLRRLYACIWQWRHNATDAGSSSEERSKSHAEPVHHRAVLYHLLDPTVHYQLCDGILPGLFHPSWADQLLYHLIPCQLGCESAVVRLPLAGLQSCSQELALLFIWQQGRQCRQWSPRQVFCINVLNSLTYLLCWTLFILWHAGSWLRSQMVMSEAITSTLFVYIKYISYMTFSECQNT